MTKFDEAFVLSKLSRRLDIKFKKRKPNLKGWGRPDGYAIVDGVSLFVEIENTQKHPDTNVLKYWPFLEEEGTEKMILVHVFSSQSPGVSGSRSSLAEWVAKKICSKFGDKFKYFRIIFRMPEEEIEGLEKLSHLIRRLKERV